jgi:hypothetical protein
MSNTFESPQRESKQNRKAFLSFALKAIVVHTLTYVIFLYQLIVFGESSFPVTLALGLLPAAIIAFTMRLNYKRPEPSA